MTTKDNRSQRPPRGAGELDYFPLTADHIMLDDLFVVVAYYTGRTENARVVCNLIADNSVDEVGTSLRTWVDAHAREIASTNRVVVEALLEGIL